MTCIWDFSDPLANAELKVRVHIRQTQPGSCLQICPRHDVNTSEYLQLQRLLMPGMESDFQCKREAPQWMPRWWRCPVIASDDLRPRVVERESPDNPRVKVLICSSVKRSCQNSLTLPQCALG